MKTHVAAGRVVVSRLISLALPAVLCAVWLSSSATTGLAQQKLKPGATVTRTVPAHTVPAQGNVRPPHDYSGIGGSVYATGLGEVTVTIHNVWEFLADRRNPYPTSVSMVCSNQEVLLGSNYQRTRTTRLGKLPRGEIQIIARCPLGDGVLRSGPGERNADRQPRSRVCEVKPGVVEVYFENTIREDPRNSDVWEQHWYKDVKLTFTGAVTIDDGLIKVLETINDPDPVVRKGARQALEMLSPTLARQIKYE